MQLRRARPFTLLLLMCVLPVVGAVVWEWGVVLAPAVHHKFDLSPQDLAKIYGRTVPKVAARDPHFHLLPPGGSFNRPGFDSIFNTTRLDIVFTVQRLDIAASVLHCSMRIVLPARVAAGITAHNKGVILPRSGDSSTVDPDWTQTNITISAHDGEHSVPFKSFVEQSTSDYGFVIGVDVPVTPEPGAYPEDRHAAHVFASVTLPTGLTSNATSDPLVATQLSLLRDNGLQDLDVRVAAVKSSEGNIHTWFATLFNPGSPLSTQLDAEVMVSRPARTQVFVWAMAATPLLLLLVAGHIAFSAGRRTFSPLEVGAALLAVLPLRAVLVPADVGGLTLVDLVLGTEVALFIVVVVAGYAINLGRIPPPGDHAQLAGLDPGKEPQREAGVSAEPAPPSTPIVEGGQVPSENVSRESISDVTSARSRSSRRRRT